MTSWHIPPNHIPRFWDRGKFAFHRQAESKPIQLACRITVDWREAQAFEPPRGSRTHVSLKVMTIRDDGTGRIKLFGSLCIQFFQVNIDCTWQMSFIVLI